MTCNISLVIISSQGEYIDERINEGSYVFRVIQIERLSFMSWLSWELLLLYGVREDNNYHKYIKNANNIVLISVTINIYL